MTAADVKASAFFIPLFVSNLVSNQFFPKNKESAKLANSLILLGRGGRI
jgi:hypothetical protein